MLGTPSLSLKKLQADRDQIPNSKSGQTVSGTKGQGGETEESKISATRVSSGERHLGAGGGESLNFVEVGTCKMGLGRASQAERKARVKAQQSRNAGIGTREAGWYSLFGRCHLEDKQEKTKFWNMRWDPS